MKNIFYIIYFFFPFSALYSIGMEKENNEKVSNSGGPAHTNPIDDPSKFEELSKRLEKAELELKRRDFEKAKLDAFSAFVANRPQSAPAAFTEILFQYAQSSEMLEISESGWKWRDSKDPIQGAADFWRKIPAVEPAPPPAQAAPQVGIPVQSQPKFTLASIFGRDN
jgi:hypothetical protein